MSITIRPMQACDLERLYELSPAVAGQGEGNVKDPAEFHAFPTIVAVADRTVARRMVESGEVPASAVSPDGLVVGYAQYRIDENMFLHSQAIRVSRKFKGRGIGEALVRERIRLGKQAGAVFHLYGVDPEGEVALKKILTSVGMHLCRKNPRVWLYAQDLGDVDLDDDPGYTEPEWETVGETIGGV